MCPSATPALFMDTSRMVTPHSKGSCASSDRSFGGESSGARPAAGSMQAHEGNEATRGCAPCLQSGGMDLSFQFSLILEESDFSPTCAHHLLLPINVSIPSVGAVGALCGAHSSTCLMATGIGKDHPQPRKVKSFSISNFVGRFCEKIKRYEKIKTCHLPLQIIQG